MIGFRLPAIDTHSRAKQRKRTTMIKGCHRQTFRVESVATSCILVRRSFPFFYFLSFCFSRCSVWRKKKGPQRTHVITRLLFSSSSSFWKDPSRCPLTCSSPEPIILCLLFAKTRKTRKKRIKRNIMAFVLCVCVLPVLCLLVSLLLFL